MKPIRFYRITAVFMSILFLLAGCQKSAAEQLKEQLELGQNYLLEMNYEGAVVAFSKAIELDPKSLEAYEGSTNVYVAQGQYDEAYVVFSQAEENITEENVIEKLRTEIPRKITETLLTSWIGTDDWQTVYDSVVSDENEELLLSLTEPVVVIGEDGQGIGIYQSSNGTCLYVGGYVDGKRNGYGIMGYDVEVNEQDPYKYFYEGEWADDYPNGEGTVEQYMVDALGIESQEVIHGTFSDGWEDGEMTVTMSDTESETLTYIYNAENGYPEMAGIDESARASGSSYFYIVAEPVEGEGEWTASIPNPRFGFWLARRNNGE